MFAIPNNPLINRVLLFFQILFNKLANKNLSANDKASVIQVNNLDLLQV